MTKWLEDQYFQKFEERPSFAANSMNCHVISELIVNAMWVLTLKTNKFLHQKVFYTCYILKKYVWKSGKDLILKGLEIKWFN